jgi:hypothetical protein
LLIAAVIAAGYFGLHRLPGASGRVAELRWQLGSPRFVGSAVNDAARLLWDADAREPGGAGRILAALVADPDPLVAGRALGLLGSELNRQTAGGATPDPGLRAAFAAWLRNATISRKVAQAELTLVCSMHLARSKSPPDLGDLPITEEDHAWMLAGLVEGSLTAQAWAAMLAFVEPQSMLAMSLWFAGGRASLPDFGPNDARLSVLSRDALAAQLRIPIARVEALLDSPLPSVRFAAGAILAFSGDARGLPATRDWLASRKLAGAPFADRMLTELFGPEWQTAP